MNAVEFELARVVISERSDAQVIVLREKDGQRCIPIEIGIVEAMAINREIHGMEMIRPMTHDLLVSVMEHLGARLVRVLVNDLVTMQEGMATFYGLLILERDGERIEVDSRPSDAIALAVRTNAPIFIAEHVIARMAEPS